eukprot:6549453-Pyramimonas_sp.AAC.1
MLQHMWESGPPREPLPARGRRRGPGALRLRGARRVRRALTAATAARDARGPLAPPPAGPPAGAAPPP